MNRRRSIAVALSLVSAAALSGCQTAGPKDTADNRIRVNSGAYHGDASALGGDIKSILMAGGLDVANPMAPTGDTNRSEIAKASPPEYNTDAMVAALSESTTRSASAAQTLKPERLNPVVQPTSKPATALALVAEPKSARQKSVILDTTIEDDTSPRIELASINMSSSGDDAFDPLPVEEPRAKPAAETAAAAIEKVSPPAVPTISAPTATETPRVRRF